MNNEVMFEFICRRLKQECLQEVSEEAKVSPSTLWKWRERKVRRPSAFTLSKVARYFGYTPVWQKGSTNDRQRHSSTYQSRPANSMVSGRAQPNFH